MEKNTILSNAEEHNTSQKNEISITEGKKELVIVSKIATKVVKETKEKSEKTKQNKDHPMKHTYYIIRFRDFIDIF